MPLRHARGRVRNAPGADAVAVRAFFDANEAWLERVLELGRAKGSLGFSGSAREEARLLVGCLEGAMLIARSYGDSTRFRDVAARFVADLT